MAKESIRLAVGSIAVAVAVFALKLLAWFLTGSLALWSDALESIVNLAASFAALVAVRLAAKPADRAHPYGHHKAEYFSAVLEGTMIIVAALLIARAAWSGIISPQMPEFTPAGLGVNALAAIVNGIWAFVLIRRGRAMGSPALVADGKHLVADVISSAAVLAGVGLVFATGWAVLDPLLALGVAANILWSGWLLVKASIGGLMDEAVEPETLDRLRTLIAESAKGAIEAHDVRTRRAGRLTVIDFHLVVPGEMSVSAAHDICDRVEGALRAEVGEALIMIHVEPEEKAKHHGVLVL